MSPAIRALFFVGDLLFLNLSIYGAHQFTGGLNKVALSVTLLYLIIFSNISWLFLVMVSTPYNVTKGWTLSKTVKSQLAFVFIHLLTVAGLVFFFQQQYSVFFITLIYLIFVPFFFFLRVLTFYLRKLVTPEISAKNFVIIGINELARETRKFYLMNPESGFKFQGYIEFDPVNFSVPALQNICVERNVHEIFYCAPDATGSALKALVNFGLDSLIKVRVIASSESKEQAISLDDFDQQPGVNLVTVPLDRTRNQFIKRVFDIAASFTFFALVLLWLLPIIALIIKIDSRGPVFFLQLRNGKGNRPFKCIKFRTMVVNTDADTRQAVPNDPRITGVGSFLRKSSIDELPQFINVLTGDMSLIGPRPHPIHLNERFSLLISNIMSRHYVKPGITGLAQCLGYRGETKDLIDMENRVRMDRYYIENWSFWLDIKIIFLTIVSLIRGSDKAF